MDQIIQQTQNLGRQKSTQKQITNKIQSKQLKEQYQEIKWQDKPQKPQQIIQIIQQVEQKVKDKKQQSHTAKISISQIIQIGSGLSKHLVYHIQGIDKHGPIDAYRRYSQFQALDNILYQRWPGCFIPFITNKIQIKNTTQNQRYVKTTLANYLIGLSYSQHLYYRQEVQLFLRSPVQNMKEMFSLMPPLKTKDVISRYRSSFQQQIEIKSPPQNMTYIKRFTTSLRKIVSCLQTLSQKVLSLAQSYETYSKNIAKYGQISKRYEQLCLNQYTYNQEQKMIITKYSQNKLAQLQLLAQKNPFYQLYTYMYNQQRDAQAFIEVILASQLFDIRRDELDNQIKKLQKDIQQIALGGTNLKVMTTRKPKEIVQEELQSKQKRLVEERGYMVQIHNILEIILAKKAISLFKKLKRDKYDKILNQWIMFVIQSNQQIVQAWRIVHSQAKKLLQT